MRLVRSEEADDVGRGGSPTAAGPMGAASARELVLNWEPWRTRRVPLILGRRICDSPGLGFEFGLRCCCECREDIGLLRCQFEEVDPRLRKVAGKLIIQIFVFNNAEKLFG